MAAVKGLFLGLTTLDVVYRVDHPPAVDEKIQASEQLLLAGGPAANAAVAFTALGGSGVLYSVLGQHPLGHLVRDELAQQGVACHDLDPQRRDPPSLSSVMVRHNGGERSVVSKNALGRQVAWPEPGVDADLLLVDGHQMRASIEAAQLARHQSLPVVMDGGSWKEGSEQLLGWVDFAICSANFHPPGCASADQVLAFLERSGVSLAAISRGADTILYRWQGQAGAIPVTAERPVQDTLAAGDILHGAFCFFLLQERDPVKALAAAVRVASASTGYFGSRGWIAEASRLTTSRVHEQA